MGFFKPTGPTNGRQKYRNIEETKRKVKILKYKWMPKRRYLLTKINSRSRGVGVVYSIGGWLSWWYCCRKVETYDPLIDLIVLLQISVRGSVET